MPRLSILIAAVGDVPALESTLLSVLENRPRGCEIIVALGVPYDNPYRLDDEVQFVSAVGGGWSECVQRGLAHCRGAYVHVLQDGVLATPNWTDAALAAFADLGVAAVSPVVRHAAANRNSATAAPTATTGVRLDWLGRRVEVNGHDAVESVLGPTHWAGFYRRESLAEVGGVSTAVGDELADLDLALRLLDRGGRTAFTIDSQVRLERDTSAVASAFSRGLFAERFYRRRRVASRGQAAMAGHMLALFREGACIVVRPSNLVRLIGRVAGSWTPGVELPWTSPDDLLESEPATISYRGNAEPEVRSGAAASTPTARRKAA